MNMLSQVIQQLSLNPAIWFMCCCTFIMCCVVGWCFVERSFNKVADKTSDVIKLSLTDVSHYLTGVNVYFDNNYEFANIFYDLPINQVNKTRFIERTCKDKDFINWAEAAFDEIISDSKNFYKQLYYNKNKRKNECAVGIIVVTSSNNGDDPLAAKKYKLLIAYRFVEYSVQYKWANWFWTGFGMYPPRIASNNSKESENMESIVQSLCQNELNKVVARKYKNDVQLD